jgi:RNA polymerase sigma factor (sigma-70 family)
MTDFLKEEDFQAFVTAHRELWVRLAHRVLGRREEAEDVVQETLAFLWERREFLKIENPTAYVARAVWLNSLKRKTRSRKYFSLEEIAEPAAPERPSSEEWEEGFHPLHLEKAFQELPESQQAVIRMKYYLGLSFREIGETLKISLNTAGSRCRYALAALSKSLKGRRNDPGGFQGPDDRGGKHE